MCILYTPTHEQENEHLCALLSFYMFGYLKARNRADLAITFTSEDDIFLDVR